MLTAEFKMEEAVKVWKEEGIEEGIEKGIKQGLEQGIEQGIEQGLEQGRFEVAQKMLSRNMSIGDIIDLTGLDEKQILAIK